MKSTVKTVKGRGRPRKNATLPSISLGSSSTLESLEREIERKDHTLEIMRDEIMELEKRWKDQKEKNAFLEIDISHLKDIIRKMADHL